LFDVQVLLTELESEARRAPFPIDTAAYEAAAKDPLVPIAFAGDAAARVCCFGRDLGRDEVRVGQPQVGAAGKLVRRGVLARLGKRPESDDSLLEAALPHVFLSNTVPYKPPGNKAYPDAIRERFRPYVARLLAEHWLGDAVFTLGTEAFFWFAPYAEPGAAKEHWKREDRYAAELACLIPSPEGRKRAITVCPLPHPSPLNAQWVGRFPGLLAARLVRWLADP